MIPETVREAARRHGDAIAYVGPTGLSISYAQLDRVSDEVAVGLAARGVREGDVVALVLPPGLEYVLSYLGAAKVGAITAGVNPRLTERERAAVVEHAAPALVIAEPNLAPDADAITVQPATTLDALLARLRAPGTPPMLTPNPDRPVTIVFTSGTTGTPKGAVFANRQLGFIADTDVGDHWGGGAPSYAGTSFAHLGFMTKLVGNLRRGATTYIMRSWRAAAALTLVAERRLAAITGVPAQLALMLRDPSFDSTDLSCVRALVVGGGPITPGLADEARRRFDAPLATRYSCTEAALGLGTAFDDRPEDAVVSVGRPLPGVDLALLDESDDAVAAGEVGQVCLRSPAVMSEYWLDPEATAAAFTTGGFVRTGDLGWLDDAGRLRLVGRTKEMYVRGGENVYPVEIESVLSEHPAVAAVAVIPRPDPVMGEIGVAVVVPRGTEPDLETLRAFAAGRVASYKLPEGLRIVDELPLTPGDKVDRRALATQVESDRIR